ncbi:sulfotransferase domain-containing protein [Ruegeria sp. Alg231-54]|nr:sulfotransferase domain-containing protein [Ruegeria sp. Alg231-54]
MEAPMGLKRLVKNWKDKQVEAILAEDGFRRCSAEAVQPIDVAFVGWPKSGNSWCQFIVANLYYGVDTSIASDKIVQDLVPDVHRSRFVRRYSEQMIVKSHNLPQPNFRKVIHLVRDGRDAMVSYYHFRKALGFKGTLNELMDENSDVYSTWWGHAAAWNDNKFNAEKMLLRYEDLLDDAENQIARIADFIGADATATRASEIAAQTTFSVLKDKEKKHGLENKDWPKDKQFFRRGKVGSFQDEMSVDDAKRFEDRAGDQLIGFGYALS